MDTAPARPSGRQALWLLGPMVLWVLAFSPEPWVLATVPGFLGLVALVERAPTTKRAILWISIFGAVAIGYGYRWLAPTIQDFGNQHVVSAWILTCLFGVVGTVHGWVFVIAWRGLRRHGHRPHPALLAILFVACECLPIRLFPWMAGHGAVDNPALRQHAEWGGVAGVSLVLLFLVAPLHEFLHAAFRKAGSPPARIRAAVLTLAVGAVAFGWGAWRVGEIRDADTQAPRHLRVAMVQGGIGSQAKRTAERDDQVARRKNIEAYSRLSQEAVDGGVDLVVWPETAITEPTPLYKQGRSVDGYLANKGWRVLSTLGERAAFLVGAYEAVEAKGPAGRPSYRQMAGRTVDRYNTAALRTRGKSGDATWSRVRKVHLIPFGETLPFGLPAEDYLPQNFTMIAGKDGQAPLTLDGLTLVPFLCYEGILPEHVRMAAGGKRADVLVSLTNDSWFGDTWEPHQHLNFTRFRAIEHRAPIVRATNTGVSAFVNAAGDVVARLGVGKAGVLTRNVPVVDHGQTLFVRFGHHLPLVLWGLTLLALVAALFRTPHHVAPPED